MKNILSLGRASQELNIEQALQPLHAKYINFERYSDEVSAVDVCRLNRQFYEANPFELPLCHCFTPIIDALRIDCRKLSIAEAWNLKLTLYDLSAEIYLANLVLEKTAVDQIDRSRIKRCINLFEIVFRKNEYSNDIDVAGYFESIKSDESLGIEYWRSVSEAMLVFYSRSKWDSRVTHSVVFDWLAKNKEILSKAAVEYPEVGLYLGWASAAYGEFSLFSMVEAKENPVFHEVSSYIYGLKANYDAVKAEYHATKAFKIVKSSFSARVLARFARINEKYIDAVKWQIISESLAPASERLYCYHSQIILSVYCNLINPRDVINKIINFNYSRIRNGDKGVNAAYWCVVARELYQYDSLYDRIMSSLENNVQLGGVSSHRLKYGEVARDAWLRALAAIECGYLWDEELELGDALDCVISDINLHISVCCHDLNDENGYIESIERAIVLGNQDAMAILVKSSFGLGSAMMKITFSRILHSLSTRDLISMCIMSFKKVRNSDIRIGTPEWELVYFVEQILDKSEIPIDRELFDNLLVAVNLAIENVSSKSEVRANATRAGLFELKFRVERVLENQTAPDDFKALALNYLRFREFDRPSCTASESFRFNYREPDSLGMPVAQSQPAALDQVA